MQALIYTYAKDSHLHERSVAALANPYVIGAWFSFDIFLIRTHGRSFLADGSILSEMFKIRQRYVRKEKIRVSIGTWNINGDKNPALEHEYPSILDAWILDGPENRSSETRRGSAIETRGLSEIEKRHASNKVLLWLSLRVRERFVSQVHARYISNWFPRNL